MTTMEKLNTTFRTVFDDDSIQISFQMTANDIDGWDSLSHMNLITAVEMGFGTTFTRNELFAFKSVINLNDTIESKINT